MATFEKTMLTAVVPSYATVEGTITSQTNDFVVFKTKKKRSSRDLTMYLPFDQIISIHTKKDNSTVIVYIEPNTHVNFKNSEFEKMVSSNVAGFATAKLVDGTLSINKKFMRVQTETSAAPSKLEKVKGSKKEGKKEKKEKKDKK